MPVYNKEKYLDESIESIFKQDYKEIELIIINDGSNDNSEKIIKRWGEKDNRIKFISQDNRGVSYSRNKGITLAKGKYIYFVDADDRIKDSTISTMVKKATETMADIIVSNFIYRRGNISYNNISLQNHLYKDKALLSTQVKYNMFFSNGRPMASVCNKLYKLSFIKSCGVEFEKGIIAEDRLFNLKCFVNLPVIKVINDYTYTINIIENSRSRTFNINYYYESLSLFFSFEKYLNQKGILNENQDLLLLTLVNDLEKIFLYCNFYSNTKLKECKRLLKELRGNDLIINTMKNVDNSRFMDILKGRKKYFIYLFAKFFLYSPKNIFALFIVFYGLLIRQRRKLK